MLFRHGRLWDLQRRGRGTDGVIDDFVDVATIAIGVYAASAGLGKQFLFTSQAWYALLFSDFGDAKRSKTHWPLPERNVRNFETGYDLIKLGKLKTDMHY